MDADFDLHVAHIWQNENGLVSIQHRTLANFSFLSPTAGVGQRAGLRRFHFMAKQILLKLFQSVLLNLQTTFFVGKFIFRLRELRLARCFGDRQCVLCF